METIDLDVEELNELLFKVQIQGADPSPAKVRMVCEGSDLGFIFDGKAGPDGLIQFNLPVMKDRLKEGLYQARVEVLIDNRYFAPVQFQVNFKKTLRVVAESVTLAPKRPDPITVVASPVAVKPRPTIKPITVQETTTLRERAVVKPVAKDLSEDDILAAAKSFVASRRKR